MSSGSAAPLVLTTACAAGAYALAVGMHVLAGGAVEVSGHAAALCITGAIYTNLFEHVWHRYGMHSRRPDRRHARHHSLFYGSKFQRSDPEALRQIVTSWYIFPLLLVLHYSVFIFLFGGALAPLFFLGVLLHFIGYEVTHWYTHVANNRFDRFVSRIPVLRTIRAVQIHHHKLHHANPAVNFNFNP